MEVLADLGLLIANGYKLNLHTFPVPEQGTSLRQMWAIRLDGKFSRDHPTLEQLRP